MIYVKANIERFVDDPSEAKKLELKGFKQVKPKAEPKKASAEHGEKEKRLVDLIAEEKDSAADDASKEIPTDKPKRRRRTRKDAVEAE